MDTKVKAAHIVFGSIDASVSSNSTDIALNIAASTGSKSVLKNPMSPISVSTASRLVPTASRPTDQGSALKSSERERGQRRLVNETKAGVSTLAAVPSSPLKKTGSGKMGRTAIGIKRFPTSIPKFS